MGLGPNIMCPGEASSQVDLQAAVEVTKCWWHLCSLPQVYACLSYPAPEVEPLLYLRAVASHQSANRLHIFLNCSTPDTQAATATHHSNSLPTTTRRFVVRPPFVVSSEISHPGACANFRVVKPKCLTVRTVTMAPHPKAPNARGVSMGRMS